MYFVFLFSFYNFGCICCYPLCTLCTLCTWYSRLCDNSALRQCPTQRLRLQSPVSGLTPRRLLGATPLHLTLPVRNSIVRRLEIWLAPFGQFSAPPLLALLPQQPIHRLPLPPDLNLGKHRSLPQDALRLALLRPCHLVSRQQEIVSPTRLPVSLVLPARLNIEPKPNLPRPPVKTPQRPTSQPSSSLTPTGLGRPVGWSSSSSFAPPAHQRSS